MLARFSSFSFYGAIFLFALFWFLLGADLPTGLTGKDEFFLSLRTPLAMMEKDVWLIPVLDEVPRIRKPPLLYWVGRVFYETFGVSLLSIRAMAVLFSAFFVVGAVALARLLGVDKTHSALLAFLIMSSLGLATESSRVMLDVPVAMFSLWALWAFLKGKENRLFLMLSSLFLALGFLTKGPVVFVLWGAGVVSLFLSGTLSFSLLFKKENGRWIFISSLLWGILALPWFLVVRFFYPELSAEILNNELAQREFLKMNFTAFTALFVLSMPWFFVGLTAIYRAICHSTVNANIFSKKEGVDRGKLPLFLLWWLFLSLLPFCFIRSFERYLIGSLIPFFFLILIFTEKLLENAWARQMGVGLSFLSGFLLFLFVLYFQNGARLFPIFLCAAILFFLAWWKKSNLWAMAVSALVFWEVVLSVIFPAIGVNAVPKEVVDFARQNEVAFFSGPQPAMLSILSGKAHRHFGAFLEKDLKTLKTQNTVIFLPEGSFPAFLREMEKHHTRFRVINRFETLASSGSGLRFAKEGATWEDWQNAILLRTLTPLFTSIYAVQLENDDEKP